MSVTASPEHFVPLNFDLYDQQRIEEYFLARSSLPFKSLEMDDPKIPLEEKVTGILEQSNGSICALAPVICPENSEPSPIRNASIIDGVLKYCKRRSLAQSQIQVSKISTMHHQRPSTKIIVTPVKLNETFEISKPKDIRRQATTNDNTPTAATDPLFTSTPASEADKNAGKPAVMNEPEIYEETVTAAQHSQTITATNGETNFNSSMLVKSRVSVLRNKNRMVKSGNDGKENIKPPILSLQGGGDNGTPCRKPLTAVSSSAEMPKHGSAERFCLHFPSMTATPKGRMSFQISGSLEWEN